MGWILAIAMFIIATFRSASITADTILIASGLFAIAGAIGLASATMRSVFTNKKQ